MTKYTGNNLRFINGLSVEETAAVLGKLRGAIKAQQFHALTQLRKLLIGENNG